MNIVFFGNPHFASNALNSLIEKKYNINLVVTNPDKKMAKHVLSLEAPDTMNLCQIRIVDTSIYNADVEIQCPLLEITLPGFERPV